MRRISIRGLLLIAGLLFGLTTAFLQVGKDNVWSRLGTAQSLVERGTLALDGPVLSIVDKVYVRGQFYSDKPPAMSLIAAAIYYPLYHSGLRLEFKTPSAAYAIITFLIMGVSSLLCLAAFYGALGYVGASESARLLMTAALAFATLFFCWTTTLNNHAFSGAWAFIGFYFLLKASNGRPEKVLGALLLAGVATGLAAASDSAAMLFVAGFGLYILIEKKLRPGVVGFALAAAVIMLPGVIANYRITGDLRPAATHAEYFHYPGSYWDIGVEHLTNGQRNSMPFALKYAGKSLFWQNGFLVYNPLLMIAIYEGVRLVLSRKPFWREAALILVLASAFMGYYFLYSSNYGGWNYSIRWFITLIPLLWFLAFPFFTAWNRTKALTYGVLFAVSAIITAVGALDQWPPTTFRRTPGFVINWDTYVAPWIAKVFSSAGK